MKMTISKIIAGFTLSAGLALALSSCQKEPNEGPGNNLNAQQTASVAERSKPIGCEADIPPALAVPDGNKLAYRVYATGSQIYEVKRSATEPNTFVWVNIAPSADLFIQPSFHNLVGKHYAGPTWEFFQGPYKNEKAVAAKLQAVSIDPTAVPWLLLKTVESLSTPGNKATYIQRVCTTGGIAPSGVPNESMLGQLAYVPYTATYLFYEKAN